MWIHTILQDKLRSVTSPSSTRKPTCACCWPIICDFENNYVSDTLVYSRDHRLVFILARVTEICVFILVRIGVARFGAQKETNSGLFQIQFQYIFALDQIGSDWPQVGQIRDFFRSDSDLKMSRIFPTWGHNLAPFGPNLT